jgi:hypothetical protein
MAAFCKTMKKFARGVMDAALPKTGYAKCATDMVF